jgi:hypothetical protein
MNDTHLLAIVEVPRENRVRCQFADCNHTVFRRIHVVRENSVVHVYGSECFKKLFAGHPVASSLPRYTSSDGRPLTDEERQLLIENTERLIQQFESEHQEKLTREATLAAARPAPAKISPSTLPPKPGVARPAWEWQPYQPPSRSLLKRAVAPISADQQKYEAKAKENVRSKYGVDPELPGWRGFVLAEIERLKREGESGS